MNSLAAGKWQVFLTSTALKQKKKLPPTVVPIFAALLWDLEHLGPIQKEWSHFSALKKGKSIPESAYHCHIKSGRPTYVVCWQVTNKKIKVLEIFYVGTHEKAPY